MSATPLSPVLFLGGYGSLGRRTAKILRQLHPELPLAIAGRDPAKAAALADELGNASATTVDIDRADLGLPGDAGFSAVVTGLRDLSLNSMRFAQARGIPYVALSDAAFEIAPLVARYIRHPTAAPILMLGHSMGAVPLLAALHFARGFRRIEAIEIGAVFAADDPFGPASATDMERIMKYGPPPLQLVDGRWKWVGEEQATRRFTGVEGTPHVGQSVGLVDVLGLASTAARSIRLDVAEAAKNDDRPGPVHEVIIEITGERADGAIGRFRYEVVEQEGYAELSAKGVAVAVEHLLGLAGNPPPAPGLYFPEVLIEPEHMTARLKSLGVTIREGGAAAA